MTLTDTITADVADVLLTDFAEAVTLAGSAVQAIVLDDFESADPRAPRLRLAMTALEGVSQGDAVVLRGTTYQIEFILPGRHGLATIGLVTP